MKIFWSNLIAQLIDNHCDDFSSTTKDLWHFCLIFICIWLITTVCLDACWFLIDSLLKALSPNHTSPLAASERPLILGTPDFWRFFLFKRQLRALDALWRKLARRNQLVETFNRKSLPKNYQINQSHFQEVVGQWHSFQKSGWGCWTLCNFHISYR